jgi:uncharacterized protein with HEPN domain
MQHNPGKLCEDILRAIQEIESFCHGRLFRDFQEDRALQLIVERELEIIGEALARLRKDHPNLAEQIRDIHKIIGLRNVLAHGYDILEHEILWDIVERKIQPLKEDVQKLC